MSRAGVHDIKLIKNHYKAEKKKRVCLRSTFIQYVFSISQKKENQKLDCPRPKVKTNMTSLKKLYIELLSNE